MAKTIVVFDSYGVTVDPSTQEYRLAATVTDGGELPTSSVFVYGIGDIASPDTDSFSRVGNPQDIQNLKLDRDLANAAGDTEYLSIHAYFQYADLDTAVQAKALLSTRINELVNAWITYENDFYVENTAQSYPVGEPGVEEKLVENYVEARDARIVAEDALSDAQDAVDAAAAEVATAQLLVEAYRECVEFLKRESSAGNDIGFIQLLNTYHGKVINEGTDAAAVWTTINTDINARLTACQTSLQQWLNVESARQQEYEESLAARAEAEQNLKAAEAAEDEALAAVLAACPDFDPASV